MSIHIGSELDKTDNGNGIGLGAPVSIPPFHTGIYARSGMGKTTLIKDMVRQAVEQGYRVLIFDSKITEPEFEGIGTTIPFYLQENTDPDVYRSLIEGVRTRGHGNMERYRSAFIKICEPHGDSKAKSFEDIKRRLQQKLSDPKIKGFTADMYSEIYHDHLKLEEMLAQHKFSDHPLIEGRGWILRVPVRDLPNLNLQGLIVRSMVEWMLWGKNNAKWIIVVDEAPNFVNQKLYNPAKSALAQLDAQGRSKQIFGWYTGQTLTGFDKGNMKNLQEWILGGEMERNEVKAVYDTQTDKVLTKDEIKKLKVREFIVSTPDWSKLVKVPDLSKKKDVVIVRTNYDTVVSNVNSEGKTWTSEADSSARESREAKSLPVVGSNPTPPHSPAFEALKDYEKSLHERGLTLGVHPKPETKPIGTFTLQVTRLTTDSVEAKLLYVIHRHGAMRQADMMTKALEYGWTISKDMASDGCRKLVKDGTLIYVDTSRNYRLPSDESFKIEEVVA